jgi:Putative nucleotidyltransferase DUF294
VSYGPSPGGPLPRGAMSGVRDAVLHGADQIQQFTHGAGILDRRISPLLVRGWLDRVTSPEERAAYEREAARAAAGLVRAGSPAGKVTGFAHNALHVRASRDAEAALGSAPCPYALRVLGSGARRKAPCAPTRTTPWCWPTTPRRKPTTGSRPGRAAGRDLGALGPARCPGEVMATNPAWRMPLGAWQDRVRPLDRAAGGGRPAGGGDLAAEQPLRRVVQGRPATAGSSGARRRRRTAPGQHLGSGSSCAVSIGAGSTSRHMEPPRSLTWPGCSR